MKIIETLITILGIMYFSLLGVALIVSKISCNYPKDDRYNKTLKIIQISAAVCLIIGACLSMYYLGATS